MGPINLQSIAHAAEGMAECVELGLAKAIGVANFDRDSMLNIKAKLVKYNNPLSVSQYELAIPRRYPEIPDRDLIRTCRAEGTVFRSYSSLAQSKYIGNHDMEVMEPVLDVLSNWPAE
jgi:diketogulonate reductase-like aldo/keto reductase